MTGELSEGPSGPGQAGYEHAGYAPGYGETDMSGAGAGSYAEGSLPAYGAGPGGGEPPPGGYGQEPQGGYGPPPPKSTPWGKVVGIGCGLLLLLLLLLGGCTALLLIAAGTGEQTPGVPGGGETEELPQPPDGVEITARPTEFEPSPLYAEGEYTSVEVSITNTSDSDIDVNPLYFTVVAADGTEHGTADAIAMDENELGVRTVAPNETVTGSVTVQGDVDVDRIVFDPFYHVPVEVPVD